MLADFARHLNGRARPQRYPLAKRRTFGKTESSPEGYVLSVRDGARSGSYAGIPSYLTMVTVDGRLWRFLQAGAKGYVDITGSAVLSRGISLTRAVYLGDDGRPWVDGGELQEPQPAEEVLAEIARGLVTN